MLEFFERLLHLPKFISQLLLAAILPVALLSLVALLLLSHVTRRD